MKLPRQNYISNIPTCVILCLYQLKKDQSKKINLDSLIGCTRFSSYLSLLKTTAFVVRFIRVCQGQEYFNQGLILSATELNDAEILWIKCIKGQSFKEEISTMSNKS